MSFAVVSSFLLVSLVNSFNLSPCSFPVPQDTHYPLRCNTVSGLLCDPNNQFKATDRNELETLIKRDEPIFRQCSGRYGSFVIVASNYRLNLFDYVALKTDFACTTNLSSKLQFPTEQDWLSWNESQLFRYYADVIHERFFGNLPCSQTTLVVAFPKQKPVKIIVKFGEKLWDLFGFDVVEELQTKVDMDLANDDNGDIAQITEMIIRTVAGRCVKHLYSKRYYPKNIPPWALYSFAVCAVVTIISLGMDYMIVRRHSMMHRRSAVHSSPSVANPSTAQGGVNETSGSKGKAFMHMMFHYKEPIGSNATVRAEASTFTAMSTRQSAKELL